MHVVHKNEEERKYTFRDLRNRLTCSIGNRNYFSNDTKDCVQLILFLF